MAIELINQVTGHTYQLKVGDDEIASFREWADFIICYNANSEITRKYHIKHIFSIRYGN